MVGAERFADLAQLYLMDAIGDIRETRAFMTSLRGHLGGWHALLQTIERGVTDSPGRAPERHGDAACLRFVALRVGIHSVGSKRWRGATKRSQRSIGVASTAQTHVAPTPGTAGLIASPARESLSYPRFPRNGEANPL